jgi:hypothetical protein
MEMGMVDERLSPRVQDRKEADGGPEVFRVGGNCAQGLGGRPEEDRVDHRLILQGDLGDRLGHGEDDVEILGVEQVGGAGVDPGGARERLTRGAMTIPAAVVPDAPVVTGVALFDVAAERGCAAGGDRGHDALVRDGQRRSHVVPIGVAVAAEHVRHGRRRRIHGRRAQRAGGVGDADAPGRGSKSSGLAVAHTCVVAIAR